jgi:RNase P subunit RPR2
METGPGKVVVVKCPYCGTQNDFTEQAKAKAAAATMRQTIEVAGKCEKCGAQIRHDA